MLQGGSLRNIRDKSVGITAQETEFSVCTPIQNATTYTQNDNLSWILNIGLLFADLEENINPRNLGSVGRDMRPNHYMSPKVEKSLDWVVCQLHS